MLSGISWAVQRAIKRAWLVSDQLDNVDFAARWPRNLVDVVSEHPKRRPDPLPPWQFQPGLNSTKAHGKFPQRLEAGRCITTAGATNRFDYQRPAISGLGIVHHVGVF